MSLLVVIEKPGGRFSSYQLKSLNNLKAIFHFAGKYPNYTCYITDLSALLRHLFPTENLGA